MSSKILSAAVIGLDAEIVEVEAETGLGEMGQFSVVGLPDAAVSESRERVRYAIKNSGFDFPKKKIGVNLAPADLRKHGPSYDLPIAISILSVDRLIHVKDDVDKMLFVGELALSGKLRPITGILPIAIKARKKGIKNIFLPRENAKEAKLIPDLIVTAVDDLRQLARHLEGKEMIEETCETNFDFTNIEIMQDMMHVRGQEHVKRALEIAAAGAHNVLMSGSPGSGKTMLARTIPSILPNLTLEEALEVTKIYSVAGKLSGDSSLVTSRPFRAPHHTASGVALVGGGAWPKPGEISLAHRGVLFADEFSEFPRQVLENLRQPLEDGFITVSRAAGHLEFPAKFILVAAMNPCPCGYLGDTQKDCVCSPISTLNYRKKISGPIIDRIDLHVEVPRIKFDKLASDKKQQCETSIDIKKRVTEARIIQAKRFKDSKLITNSEMSSQIVKQFCQLDAPSAQIMKSAVEQMHLSARAYFRILKLARTIADLASVENIQVSHLAEALQYRPKE